MDTAHLTMVRSEARELYEKYQGAMHYGEGIDREIARCYRLLGQGKLIIKALESIKNAGLNDEGLPKLAMLRADAKECWLEMWMNGSAHFRSWENRWSRKSVNKSQVNLPAATFPPRLSHLSNRKAIVPIVPLHLRPKHKMSNYHILWEADWRIVPRDPYLLRRLGKGDLWLVVAMWDLTEVERAALQARV
jgi:hypothetical protein